jgi:hypothetical protein
LDGDGEIHNARVARLTELTSADAVREAMAEFDDLGRDEFLKKYEFGRSDRYFLREDDRLYDSKAILGAAYGYQHPDNGPLASTEFSGGEKTVRARLEKLGFNVDVVEAERPSDHRVWLVRAGRDGENEELALSEGAVVIGWDELPDLGEVASREELREMYERAYPGENPAKVGQGVGQLFKFVRDIQVGDLVILPLKTQPGRVAVGRVTGPYRYRAESEFASDANHTHPVAWLAKDAPYESFDETMRDAFGLQGTVREVHQPGDAYAHILAVLGGQASTDAEAVHLVVKWSAQGGRPVDTVERHQRIAEDKASVWWGLGTKDADWHIDEQWLERLRGQIAAGTPTFVFISGPSCWKTDLRAITFSREETNEELIPDYYASAGLDHHHLWVELANFESTDRDELLQTLDPERKPKRGKPVALGNQTNPLFVRLRTTPRIWWVNQGASYQRAREGGYLWAPTQTKTGGTAFDHWRNMRCLRDGDFVLNYANTRIRAVSRVKAEATPSGHPDPADEVWSDEGLRAEVEYRDLAEPVALGDIPNEWRMREEGPFAKDGNVKQGYLFPLSDRFAQRLNDQFPQLGLPVEAASADERATELSIAGHVEPPFETIFESIRQEGMTIATDMVRRYHLSLKTRGFVVLSGISGTGKTWLAEAYARAIGARCLLVPVAPNWTTNEDLLGYLNPVDGMYHDTGFSVFLREAAEEHSQAVAAKRAPRPYHLVLDEMNLARVEQYFAKFLSAMELRTRSEDARIELAPKNVVALTPNLRFVGTINVDETTHGFADKVYDRSQLIELTIEKDDVLAHLSGRPYASVLAEVWEIFNRVAPFAFRVLDEINGYVDEAATMNVPWQAAFDEQLLQKVLTKVKGTDLALGGALQSFVELAAERFPLSHVKADRMRAAFTEHGFTSYF